MSLRQTHLTPVSGILAYVASVLVSLFLLCPLHAAETKPKLALCASGDKKAGDIVALMGVPLSRDGKVDLLDRADIDKVLVEHKLALSGMLSTEDALKVGKLLQCDIFSELHCEKVAAGNPDVLSLVAFDAVTGVRLCDAAVQSEDDIEKIAGAAITIIRTSLGKWQGTTAAGKCRTLSLVSVRNVDLPVSLAHIPNAIGPVLERQILQSAGIALLERKRLEYVNKEAEISAERRDRLLASSVLLDLDVSRKGSKDEIGIKVLISDPGGKEIAVINGGGDSAKLVDILQELTGKIVAVLKVSAIQHDRANISLEADRLLDEIARLGKRGAAQARLLQLEETALALSESALLYEPDSVKSQKRISDLERKRFARLMDEKCYDEALILFDRDLKRRIGWSVNHDMCEDYYGSKEMYERLWKVRASISGAGADTFKSCRRMMGKWWKEGFLSKSHWDYGFSLPGQCVFWAETPEEQVLEWRYSPYFPFYNAAGSPSPCTNIFGVLSQKGREEMLKHLARWSKSEVLPPSGHWRDLVDGCRMVSYLQIAELAHTFPTCFSNSESVVSSNIQVALRFALTESKIISSRDIAKWLGCLNLPKEKTIVEVLGIVKGLEGTTRNGVDLFLWLDQQAQTARSCNVGKVEEQKEADRHRAADFPEGKTDNSAIGAQAVKDGKPQGIEPEEGYFLLKAWAQLCDPNVQWDSQYGHRERAKKNLQWLFRNRYQRDLPDLDQKVALSKIVPWVKQECWFETPATNRMWIQAATIEGDTLYVLLQQKLPRQGYEVQALDMRSGKRSALASIDTKWLLSGPVYAGKAFVHLPTSGGILSFPVDGSAVTVLTETNGLPSREIQSCAEVDGVLYVGATVNGEGCLVAVRLDGKGSDILATSGRKEKKSDLDNRTPFRIVAMVRDVVGNRLLLNLTGKEERQVLADGQPLFRDSEVRLWYLDLASAKISRLVVTKSTRREVGRNMVRIRGFVGDRPGSDGPRLLPDGKWIYKEHMAFVGDDSGPNAFIVMVYDKAISDEQRLVGAVLPDWQFQARFIDRAWQDARLEGIIPWKDQAVFLCNDTAWRVLKVKDGATFATDLPKLGDSHPFFLWVHGERLIACTPQGVWALEVGPLPEDKMHGP